MRCWWRDGNTTGRGGWPWATSAASPPPRHWSMAWPSAVLVRRSSAAARVASVGMAASAAGSAGPGRGADDGARAGGDALPGDGHCRAFGVAAQFHREPAQEKLPGGIHEVVPPGDLVPVEGAF